MPKQLQIEAHILVGEDGDFVISKETDNLVELYEEEFGTLPAVTRVFTVQLHVPTPSATIVAAKAGEQDATVAVKLG